MTAHGSTDDASGPSSNGRGTPVSLSARNSRASPSRPTRIHSHSTMARRNAEIPSAQKDVDDPTSAVDANRDSGYASLMSSSRDRDPGYGSAMSSSRAPTYMHATGPLYLRGRSSVFSSQALVDDMQHQRKLYRSRTTSIPAASSKDDTRISQ